MNREFLASKDMYFSWFRSFKAFDYRHDGRTYTQVLTAQSQFQCHNHPTRDSMSTGIVATRQKNASAKLVTPSKVGMKNAGNIPPGTKGRATV